MPRLPLRPLASLALLAAFALAAPLAQAHAGAGLAGGFMSGFAHPLLHTVRNAGYVLRAPA